MSDHLAPDDQRHGTRRGYGAGCRADCCHRAMIRYDKMRRLEAARGTFRSVPSIGTARRLQALTALGWNIRALARETGCEARQIRDWTTSRHDTIFATTAARIADLYDRLSMSLPPERNTDEKNAASRARGRARRNGWVPPLCWDDKAIDDPHAEPIGIRGKAEPKRTWTDPIVVNELLAGRTVDSTPGEKTEAMRRWLAMGKSARSLEVRHGWRSGRHMPRRQEKSA